MLRSGCYWKTISYMNCTWGIWLGSTLSAGFILAVPSCAWKARKQVRIEAVAFWQLNMFTRIRASEWEWDAWIFSLFTNNTVKQTCSVWNSPLKHLVITPERLRRGTIDTPPSILLSFISTYRRGDVNNPTEISFMFIHVCTVHKVLLYFSMTRYVVGVRVLCVMHSPFRFKTLSLDTRIIIMLKCSFCINLAWFWLL